MLAPMHFRDPVAKNNNTKLTINCTGTAVNNPSSLLQRLLLPVAASDIVNAEEALKSIAPAKEAPAAGEQVQQCYECICSCHGQVSS
jgi:hypothetical protein